MPGVDGFRLLQRYRENRGARRRAGHHPVEPGRSATTRAALSPAAPTTTWSRSPTGSSWWRGFARTRRPTAFGRERDAAYRALEELKLQLEQKNAILLELSELDGLTGIANRRRFDQALDVEWRRCHREGSELALILIDVDFFKRYNDSYGHLMGDEVLRRVAASLGQALRRSSDLVARFGGEEFGVLLPATDAAEAALTAEKLRETVYDLAIPHARSEIDGRVTISLGVASITPAAEVRTGDLVALADEALYEAKRGGRNRAAVAAARVRA